LISLKFENKILKLKIIQAKFYFEVLQKNYPKKDITFVLKTRYGKSL